MILKKPSAILCQWGVQSRREYACRIFHSLQQTDHNARFFDTSFMQPTDALEYATMIRKRLNHAVECFGVEDCILLPPLFVRAHEDSIVRLSPNVMLVLCRDGPVFPVLWIHIAPLPTQATTMTMQPTMQELEQQLEQNQVEQKQPEQKQPEQKQPEQQPEQSTPISIHTRQLKEMEEDMKHDDKPNTGTNIVETQMVSNTSIPEESRVASTTHLTDDANAHVTGDVQTMLTQVDELRYVRDILKTPIAVTILRQQSVDDSDDTSIPLSRQDQYHKCASLGEAFKLLQCQRKHMQQLTTNPNVQITTKTVLQQMIEQRDKDIQHALSVIQVERSRLTEAQQVNEVARLVLVSDKSANPQWYTDIMKENSHLQSCLDCLPMSA